MVQLSDEFLSDWTTCLTESTQLVEAYVDGNLHESSQSEQFKLLSTIINTEYSVLCERYVQYWHRKP